MIAKNGDKVVITRGGETGGVRYKVGDHGVMVNKADTENTGGWVSLDSGKVVYLFQDEYNVIVGENASQVLTTAVTAESLRNRFLEIEKEEDEISKKIDALSEEKTKIEDDLRVMGFILCSPSDSGFMPILDDKPEMDYNDWHNWKQGDTIECINAEGWGSAFKSGNIYTVNNKNEYGIWVEGEVGAEYITEYISDFKFHSPF